MSPWFLQRWFVGLLTAAYLVVAGSGAVIVICETPSDTEHGIELAHAPHDSSGNRSGESPTTRAPVITLDTTCEDTPVVDPTAFQPPHVERDSTDFDGWLHGPDILLGQLDWSDADPRRLARGFEREAAVPDPNQDKPLLRSVILLL